MEEEARPRREEGEAPVAGWQTIYCSLALILVAFFAMLVSYSSLEEKKVSLFKYGRGKIDAGNPLSGLDMMKLSRQNAAEREEHIMTAMESLTAYLGRMGLDQVVYIERTTRGFKVTFPSHLFFESGGAAIKEEAHPSLTEIGKIAKAGQFALRVEGHTDDVPIRTAQFPSNWELSATRAVNVLRYIHETGGISTEKLSAEGFSQYQPLVPNDTPEGRKKNRRVAFSFDLPA